MASLARDAHEALLGQGGMRHIVWATTAAAYEALHLVEAVAAIDPEARAHRGSSHEDRRDMVNRLRCFRPVAADYLALQDASRIARYMVRGPRDFTEFFAQPNVVQVIFVRRLGAVRAWAANRLGMPEIGRPSPLPVGPQP